MRPIPFKQASIVLRAPEGMESECGKLQVWTDGTQCVSVWKMSWKERLKALLIGRVWLFVIMGSTQPPVALEVTRTVFADEKPAPEPDSRDEEVSATIQAIHEANPGSGS